MPKSSIYTLILIALLVIVIGAFYWAVTRPRHPSMKPARQAVSAADLNHFSIFLHRGGCIGDCPAYAVLAKGSGKLTFSGGKHVEVTGKRKSHVSDRKLKKLYRATKHAGFFDIDDIYHNGPGGTGCEALSPGKPRVVIGVTKQDRTKVIHYNTGCKGAPPKLKRLADTIDRVLNTGRWVGNKPR
jgi:hypothetical protein